MVLWELTDGQAIMLQNALTTIQGECDAGEATQFMELRILLEEAMNHAKPHACRVLLYYQTEELQVGQLPSEPTVEMHYHTKREAAEVMLKMVEASRTLMAQPTKPRNYVLNATPGHMDVSLKPIG